MGQAVWEILILIVHVPYIRYWKTDLINMREWFGLSFPGRFENIAGSFDPNFKCFDENSKLTRNVFSNNLIRYNIFKNMIRYSAYWIYFLKWRPKVVNKGWLSYTNNQEYTMLEVFNKCLAIFYNFHEYIQDV